MKVAHNYYVYIVQCSDGTYYVGITNDIERRLWEHNTGYSKASYTFSRRPVELKYAEHFSDSLQAIAREKQIKGWSKAKKEALFREDWEAIGRLAVSKNRPAQKQGEPFDSAQGDKALDSAQDDRILDSSQGDIDSAPFDSAQDDRVLDFAQDDSDLD